LLKHRVIPVLLYRDGGLVKGRQFDSWRRIGSPMPAVRVHEARQVDELIFLDIGATPNGTPPDFALVEQMADECFMPLTVGGGIRTLDHIRTLLAIGADKVAINTAAMEDPSLIERAALKFGSQCITISIDVLGGQVVGRCGSQLTRGFPIEWACMAQNYGAGEILLNDIDRDGTLEGYNLDLIQKVSKAIEIPVIACGGAGCPEDFTKAIQAGASAVAAGAMFAFTEETPLTVKRAMHETGIAVRL
jgi:cyclase